MGPSAGTCTTVVLHVTQLQRSTKDARISVIAHAAGRGARRVGIPYGAADLLGSQQERACDLHNGMSGRRGALAWDPRDARAEAD